MATPPSPNADIEISDPPIPSRNSPVSDWSIAEKLKATVQLIAAGSMACAGSWWLLHNDHMIWGTILGGFGVFTIIAALGPKSLKAACPYCEHVIDTIPTKDHGESAQVSCENCYEYSIVRTRLLRPVDAGATSDAMKFECPAFYNAVWPKGCVACGAEPVRCDDLSKFDLGGAEALLGSVTVMRGAVSGIPYCASHKDRLRLKIADHKLVLCWFSMRMMRRYLAANRHRTSSQPISFGS